MFKTFYKKNKTQTDNNEPQLSNEIGYIERNLLKERLNGLNDCFHETPVRELNQRNARAML